MSRSRKRLIRVTADGADLIHQNLDETFWSLRWRDVDEIIAFKVDAITFDHLCLGFRRIGETSFVATDEDTPGWKELNDQLCRTFNVSLDQWFSDVAFPAFKENRTVLWSRSNGSASPLDHSPVVVVPLKAESFEVVFDGMVLRRGFWLYVVELRDQDRLFAYVGRTGDTSSPKAGSLFSRIASHLNPKASAKGNSLFRHLQRQNVEWQGCSYRFIGIGPLFAQQETMPLHVPVRDEMAALERAVADILKQRGYTVLGTHPKRRPVRPELLTAVITELDRLLEARANFSLQLSSRRYFGPALKRLGRLICDGVTPVAVRSCRMHL